MPGASELKSKKRIVRVVVTDWYCACVSGQARIMWSMWEGEGTQRRICRYCGSEYLIGEAAAPRRLSGPISGAHPDDPRNRGVRVKRGRVDPPRDGTPVPAAGGEADGSYRDGVD